MKTKIFYGQRNHLESVSQERETKHFQGGQWLILRRNGVIAKKNPTKEDLIVGWINILKSGRIRGKIIVWELEVIWSKRNCDVIYRIGIQISIQELKKDKSSFGENILNRILIFGGYQRGDTWSVKDSISFGLWTATSKQEVIFYRKKYACQHSVKEIRDVIS